MAYDYTLLKLGGRKGEKYKPISEKRYERMKERFEKQGSDTKKNVVTGSSETVNKRQSKVVIKSDPSKANLLYTEKKKSKGRDFPLSPTPGV